MFYVAVLLDFYPGFRTPVYYLGKHKPFHQHDFPILFLHKIIKGTNQLTTNPSHGAAQGIQTINKNRFTSQI
jgi:hypothetical protein